MVLMALIWYMLGGFSLLLPVGELEISPSLIKNGQNVIHIHSFWMTLKTMEQFFKNELVEKMIIGQSHNLKVKSFFRKPQLQKNFSIKFFAGYHHNFKVLF